MARASTIRTLVLVAIAGVAVVAVALLWWSDGDVPEPVDGQRSASDGPQEPQIEVEVEDPDLPETSTETDPSGRWVVDTSQPFDRAAGSGTFVGYRVDEELVNVGFTTAVGRTPDVEGHVDLEGLRVTEVRVLARLDGLESDRSTRDGRVRSMLGPGATAEFTMVEPLDLQALPGAGAGIEVSATGLLRVREASREVPVDLTVMVDGDVVVVTGSTVILLEDLEVHVPSASSVISASDEATLEWQLYLVRG